MRSSEFGIARKVLSSLTRFPAEFTTYIVGVDVRGDPQPTCNSDFLLKLCPIYNSIEKSDLKRPLLLFVVLAFEYISPFSFEGTHYKHRKN